MLTICVLLIRFERGANLTVKPKKRIKFPQIFTNQSTFLWSLWFQVICSTYVYLFFSLSIKSVQKEKQQPLKFEKEKQAIHAWTQSNCLHILAVMIFQILKTNQCRSLLSHLQCGRHFRVCFLFLLFLPQIWHSANQNRAAWSPPPHLSIDDPRKTCITMLCSDLSNVKWSRQGKAFIIHVHAANV